MSEQHPGNRQTPRADGSGDGGQHWGPGLFRHPDAATDPARQPSEAGQGRAAATASAAPFQQADEGDRAEQHRTVVPPDEDDMRSLRFPFEADPADALDQRRSVPVDDEDA